MTAVTSASALPYRMSTLGGIFANVVGAGTRSASSFRRDGRGVRLSVRHGGFATRLVDMIEAVVFDVGETLVNETREYGAWADWLGVPRHTFSSVFGAAIIS